MSTERELPLWEVFVRSRRGLSHNHAGSVHAADAVMALRKKQIESMGGFEALADYLADDYQIGNRIARSGSRIDISPVVVECRSATVPWKDAWAHQKRWARTIRVSPHRNHRSCFRAPKRSAGVRGRGARRRHRRT